MKSVKSRLIFALSLVELLTLGMAVMLYAGSDEFDDNARRTRKANDDLRELLDFSLVSHGYMDAFGRSLGQRTLIANRDRREAAAAFDARIAKIPEMHEANTGLSTLDWQELQAISGQLSAGLRAADGHREQGDFVQAERRFAEVRQSVFGARMLPWFERAIAALSNDARTREAEALDSAARLRTTGVVLALLSSGVASIAVLWISGSIVRPVSALVAGAEAIRRGDLEHRVRLAGNDELALVSDSFNRMAETLAASQASLLAQNEKLERAYRLQGEFISMVTHELRSPLHSIQGYLEFIEDDEPALAAASRRHLSAIGESAKRLLCLVNDILDFSKLEARQLDVVRQRIELGPLLEQSVADARALVRERPIEVVFDALPEPVSVYSDQARLRQILTNLLSNAVKFTERGRVTLLVALEPQSVELTVSDTGIGIPEAQLGAIFEPFRQAASAGNFAHGGTGLGLAIVARLSELIGARISVRSEPGQGSDFSVSLPRAGQEMEEAWPIS
jgi:signal transduction histidine kinase